MGGCHYQSPLRTIRTAARFGDQERHDGEADPQQQERDGIEAQLTQAVQDTATQGKKDTDMSLVSLLVALVVVGLLVCRPPPIGSWT